MQDTMTQEKTGYEMAAEYAAGIVEGVKTLDVLAENIETVLDYAEALANCDLTDPDDAETLTDYADALDVACGGRLAVSEVLQLWHELGRPSDASEVISAWVDGALDIEVRGTWNNDGEGRWAVDAVAFLLTAGGPTARVVWDGSALLAVECSWSSETVTRRVECDALASWAEDLAADAEEN